jgi:sarcosine oxidase subunit beta
MSGGDFVERTIDLRWAEPKRSYEVVIVGGGGHGLATAYYLAARHGLRDVAVLEADYVGSGNSGRNTTIIRANYGVPEAIKFYAHSQALYGTLEEELDCSFSFRRKGLIWLAHTETALRAERARCLLDQACGVETVFVGPSEIVELCPQIDLTGGGRYPVLGASYHPGAATARHDRVVWGYASGAMRHGVHVLPHTPVTGLLTDGGRVTGVRTANGQVSAGVVVSAVGGHGSVLASMAGVRLPIRTHPLQAFVTNDYGGTFDPIVSDTELLTYVSQTERGQILIGAEFDRQPSYSRRSSFGSLAMSAAKVTLVMPFLRSLRVLRQWAGICDVSADFTPIMGSTGVDGFLITTGWGTWGFKAIPAGGEAMAELIATGRTPTLIAPFALARFASDHVLADQGSTGTR